MTSMYEDAANKHALLDSLPIWTEAGGLRALSPIKIALEFERLKGDIFTLRNDLTAARLERSNLQDIDLAPIKRTQANLWQLKYFEALQATNKGAQRLRRRLDEAQRRLRRAGRPLEEREAPHCPSCNCGLHPSGSDT